MRMMGSGRASRSRTARASQFGSLPHASGIASVPCATGDGSRWIGRDASQAATAVTSLSVRLAATICMQSGSAASLLVP